MSSFSAKTAVTCEKPGEGAPIVDGKPGWQSDGSYLTPEGQRLTTELVRLAQTLADLLAGEVDVELFREDGGDL
jgi:hypothetical protein